MATVWFSGSKCILPAVLLAGCATPGLAETPDAPAYLQKDFQELTALFEGQWENDRQVFFAAQAGLHLDEVAPRQSIKIERIEATDASVPSVDFLAERSVEGGPIVSLIHTFSIDAANKQIRQDMVRPGSTGEPSEPVDCSFHWSREGGQFSAFASGAGCNALFPRPEAEGDLQVTAALSETEYWVSARRGGETVSAQMRRARPFECWVAILRGAEHGDSGEGSSDWQFRQGVEIHDQGGEAEIVTDETPARTVRLRLRDVDWTYGTRRPSLTLYALEGDNDRPVSYAWTEGGADRIGLNLRWLQASCTAAEE